MSSYPKKSKSTSQRSSRPRKKNPSLFLKKSSEKTDEPAGQSTSAKKQKSASSEDVHWNHFHGYRFIEFFTVFTALSELVICRECKQNLKFEEAGNRGLGFKLVLLCRCGRRDINSGPIVNTGYEVNRRIVLIMYLLGIGRKGLNIFCNYMDICNGLAESTYNNIMEHIYSVTKTEFEFCTQRAVDEEQKENIKRERPISHLKVSGEGSWKKRGFTSLYGVTTLIAYYSGKVIDLVVNSSYCHACTVWKNKMNTEEYLEWYEEHKEECQNNHEGSAKKMEVTSVTEMFLRSEEKYGVKYSNYIGDGDSKTFKAILDVNPYGDNFQVIKSECIGHVQKRMGARLRGVKKTHKLGGKGKLTEKFIEKLTSYYGLAIKRNVNNVDNMKKAIMATYYHMCSTNKNPRHEDCPPGADSWCKWQKAKAIGENYEHPAPLHPDVQKHILPIYEDLSKEDLLQRCLGGHTQNMNESFNWTVWRFAPNHLHCGLKIVEIAAYLAAGIFNEGHSFILRIMSKMDLVIGKQSKSYADDNDERRTVWLERRSLSQTKEACTARRNQLLIENELYKKSEGLLYGPGIAY